MPDPGGRRTRLRTALRRGAAAPLLAARRSVRDGRIVRLQAAWALLMIASWAAVVTLSVVAFAEGGSSAVAVAVLARTVPGVVAGPLVGLLVDRVSHRWTLSGAALTFALALAAAALVDDLVAVISLVTAAALATMVTRAATSAVVPDLVDDPADLAAANVLSSAVEAVGVFAGPALAGLLLALAGPTLAFGAASALSAVAAVLLVGLRTGRHAAGGVGGGARGSFGELAASRRARLLMTLIVFQTMVSGALSVLYPALSVETLGRDLSTVGLLAAAFGLGGAAGSLLLFGLAGSQRLAAYCTVSLLLWSLPLVVVPLFADLGSLLGLLAVVGLGNVLFDVTVITLLQRALPTHLLGRAFGVVESAVVVGLGLGAGLATLLLQAVAPAAALALSALPLAVVALLTTRAMLRLDRELVAPTRQVALLREIEAFALLPTPALELLALQLVRTGAGPGEVVARQGEPGHTWFLVDSGSFTVTVDGREVGTMTAGDGFGEVALLRTGTRTATVTAVDDGVLWRLDRDLFLAVLRADDGRALAALDTVAAERLARAAPRQG